MSTSHVFPSCAVVGCWEVLTRHLGQVNSSTLCVSAARFQVEVCGLMCEKLKLSTWKVQLAVLQSMKAYFQG